MSKFEKAPILSTAIVPEVFDAETELAFEHAYYFDLDQSGARSIFREVELAIATWREVAHQAGANKREIEEVESAFE